MVNLEEQRENNSIIAKVTEQQQNNLGRKLEAEQHGWNRTRHGTSDRNELESVAALNINGWFLPGNLSNWPVTPDEKNTPKSRNFE